MSKTQLMQGTVTFKANKEQTFDTELTVEVPVLELKSVNKYDMKDPEYRGYNQKCAEY